jgi:hypothetical protein
MEKGKKFGKRTFSLAKMLGAGETRPRGRSFVFALLSGINPSCTCLTVHPRPTPAIVTEGAAWMSDSISGLDSGTGMTDGRRDRRRLSRPLRPRPA